MLIKVLKYAVVSLAKLLSVVGITFAKGVLGVVILMFVILMLPYWFYTTKRNISAASDTFFKPQPIQKSNSSKS